MTGKRTDVFRVRGRTEGIFERTLPKPPCKAPTSRRAQTAQATKDREDWAALRPDMKVEKAIPYRLADIYHTRDLMQHPSFGLGLVTREAGPHKIKVLFEGGKKLLCCQ